MSVESLQLLSAALTRLKDCSFTDLRRRLFFASCLYVRDEAAVQAALFQESLEATREAGTSPRGTVWRAIVNTYGFLFSVAGVIKIVHDGAMFAAPFILQRLLAHLGAGGERSTAFGWAAAMLAAGVIETLTINVYFHILWRMCLHLKLSMIDMLYDKSLRITSTVKSTMGVGAIANLQSNDAAKLWNLPLYMHVLWNGTRTRAPRRGVTVHALVRTCACALATTRPRWWHGDRQHFRGGRRWLTFFPASSSRTHSKPQ